MPKIVIAGGTGYAGAAVAREAASRGHTVTVVSRSAPEAAARVAGVEYVSRNVADGLSDDILSGADALVSTLSPRGELDGQIVDVDLALAAQAREHNARFIVLGGYSSLIAAEGELNNVEGGRVPAEYASEASQMNTLLRTLQAQPEGLDWLFVSPAEHFGSYAPGEALGQYRVGGEVALRDENGHSAISGADLARAIVDEIEAGNHHRAHISVAY